ncbi:MAG TPA: pyruvate dehydrogenase (acetyl-transferring) E1 component subunit alpha [Herpetosiphonaceae bacterium]
MNKQDLVADYRMMLLIRSFEEHCQQQYTRARIGGFLHLYVGQEAVAVGAIGALKPQDHIVTHYRDHGHALARGLEAKPLMAELFGRTTGVDKGKGGSMHFADKSKNFWGGYAIVGAHLLIAMGIAYSIQYREEDGVVMCFFGDGATNGGEFYEALNFAALYKLPIVFVCENNEFAMGTPLANHSAVTEIHRKANAFDIPNERINGNDIALMRQTAEKAVEHARSGKGPYFIEAMTYRLRGHSAADPQMYRTRDDVAARRSGDPIALLRQQLIDEKLLTAKKAKQMEDEVEKEMEEVIKFAEESPHPDLSEVWTEIYSQPV